MAEGAAFVGVVDRMRPVPNDRLQLHKGPPDGMACGGTPKEGMARIAAEGPYERDIQAPGIPHQGECAGGGVARGPGHQAPCIQRGAARGELLTRLGGQGVERGMAIGPLLGE